MIHSIQSEIIDQLDISRARLRLVRKSLRDLVEACDALDFSFTRGQDIEVADRFEEAMQQARKVVGKRTVNSGRRGGKGKR